MQYYKTTIGLEWFLERMDYLLTWSFKTRLRSFGNCFARHGDTISVQITTFQKTLH